jgi:hypothetical protein
VGVTPISAPTQRDLHPAVSPAAPLPPPNVIVAGCHGGAGATTLTRLLSRTTRPYDAGTLIRNPGSTPLILVARGDFSGAEAATKCLNNASRMGVLPIAIVVMADNRLPEPKGATLRFHLLQPRVRAGIVRFPYVERWRYEGFDLNVPLPRKAQTALDELHQVLTAWVHD